MRAAPTPTEVIGREQDLEHVEAWVARFAAGPAALLVRGEAGIGKTTVWGAAVEAARAAGACVLVTRPAEAELPLGYAGLGDLLEEEAAALLELLPEPLARGLAAALLLQDAAEPAEPVVVVRAVRAALLELASRAPVVVAIDDLQWLDRGSARALAFAVRRLEGSPVGILAALRDGHADPLGLVEAFGERTVELRLEGLTLGASGRLLRSRIDGQLPRRAVVAAHERAAGNPFITLELARVGEATRLPASLREIVERRLAAAPDDVMPAIELAAVLGPAPVGAFDDGASLDAAIEAGLVVEEHGEVRFAHPLLAAGAYEGIPPARRRRLHLQAAERSESLEVHARHLALAAEVADAGVSALLEDAARAARARGAPEAAAELAAESRRLTPPEDVEALARRMLDESDYLFLAADEPGTRTLVDDVLASEVRGAARTRALVARALLESAPEAAVSRLEEAVREPHADEQLAARALSQLAWQRACWLGDVEPAVPEAMAAVVLAEQTGDDATLVTTLTTAGLVGALAGDSRAESAFRRALELVDGVHLAAGDRAPRSAFAHERFWRGDWATAEELFARERLDAERQGDEWLLMRLEIFEADFALYRGRWDESERLLDAVLVEAHDYWRAVALGKRAILRGRRGDPAARDDADELAGTPLAAGDPVLGATAVHAIGLLDLAGGRAGEAADRLTTLTNTLDRAGARRPDVEGAIPETVVALVEAGRRSEADALSAHLERRAARLADAWVIPAAELCRGLVSLGDGDVDSALVRLGAARAGFDALGAPWQLAQTLLAQGRALRRGGRRTDAATALERAAGVFAELRAWPWRELAVEEQRRATPRPRRDHSLTAAENRVAAQVAAGRTNKEVAAHLFTTVATVEAHLTRIYRKLDLRSRTELARAVADGRVDLEE